MTARLKAIRRRDGIGAVQPNADLRAGHDAVRRRARDNRQVAQLDARALLAQIGDHGAEVLALAASQNRCFGQVDRRAFDLAVMRARPWPSSRAGAGRPR